MFLEQLIESLNAVASGMRPEPPKPALPANKWRQLGQTAEARTFHSRIGRKTVTLKERPVLVFSYYERNSKYDGAALRKIRARNGVGRPPRNKTWNLKKQKH